MEGNTEQNRLIGLPEIPSTGIEELDDLLRQYYEQIALSNTFRSVAESAGQQGNTRTASGLVEPAKLAMLNAGEIAEQIAGNPNFVHILQSIASLKK